MIDARDTSTRPLTGVDPRWMALLRQAVRDTGKGGVTKVARRLIKPKSSPSSVGDTYNRSYVSRYLIGNMDPAQASPHFVASVLAAFGDGRLDCPHLKTDIAVGECKAHAAITWGQVSGTGYERLDQWRACDKCLQNPTRQIKPAGATS